MHDVHIIQGKCISLPMTLKSALRGNEIKALLGTPLVHSLISFRCPHRVLISFYVIEDNENFKYVTVSGLPLSPFVPCSLSLLQTCCTSSMPSVWSSFSPAFLFAAMSELQGWSTWREASSIATLTLVYESFKTRVQTANWRFGALPSRHP